MRGRQQAARLGVLAYDGVEPIDIGGTLGVVSMARRVLPVVQAALIAPVAGPVRLADGLVVMAPCGLADAPACDAVIVCGGPGWPAAAADPVLRGWLRGLAPDSLASVCTGAMILDAAGLLAGRMATTRRTALGSETLAPLRSLSPAVQAVEAAVVDDTVVTGGGVSLAIDATLYLLARLYGHEAADEVARMIEYDRALAANRAALGVRVAGDAPRRPASP